VHPNWECAEPVVVLTPPQLQSSYRARDHLLQHPLPRREISGAAARARPRSKQFAAHAVIAASDPGLKQHSASNTILRQSRALWTPHVHVLLVATHLSPRQAMRAARERVCRPCCTQRTLRLPACALQLALVQQPVR
jgi:hypothetical protein